MSIWNSMGHLFFSLKSWKELKGLVVVYFLFEFYHSLLHALYNRFFEDCVWICLFHFHFKTMKREKYHRPLKTKMKCSLKFINQLCGYSQFECNAFFAWVRRIHFYGFLLETIVFETIIFHLEVDEQGNYWNDYRVEDFIN